MEKWKKIPGYEWYEASSLGNLRSLTHKDFMGRVRLGVAKTLNVNPNGYVQTQLWVGPTMKNCYAHRLVALTFVPNPNNLGEINHKNGIKTDNRPENLEWCTASENKKHAYRTGLNKKRGKRIKLNELLAEEIRSRVASGEVQRHLAKEYGVSPMTINRAAHKISWG